MKCQIKVCWQKVNFFDYFQKLCLTIIKVIKVVVAYFEDTLLITAGVMGKTTEVDGDNNPTSPESDPTKLLEAALQQMDGIIAGKCRRL